MSGPTEQDAPMTLPRHAGIKHTFCHLTPNCPDPGVSRRFRCPGMLPQCYPAPAVLFFQVSETAVFQRFYPA